MIYFTIKFLICFTKPKAPVTKANLKKVQSLKKKSNKLNGVEEEKLEGDNKNIVRCKDNGREWCHIEYCLLGEVLPKVEINVVTWGEAAKIYINDNYKSVKTVTFNNEVWVFFTLLHKILNFEYDEILQFKNNDIKFTFSQDQSKFMAIAVNDWPKEFKLCKIPTDLKIQCDAWFHELFQTYPLDETYIDIQEEQVDSYKKERPEKNKILSTLIVKPCERKFKTKIYEIMTTLPSISKSLLKKKSKNETIKLKKKKANGKKDKGIDTDDRPFLSLKTHPLIAGVQDVCSEKVDITPTLRYAGVFASTERILTDEQNFDFVPLVITIQSVEGLPDLFMGKFDLENVFARYEFGNIIDAVETIKKPLNEDVKFEDTQVFFMSSMDERKQHQLMLRPSVLSLAEALLTRRFVVKLYGNIDIVEPNIIPCLFGDDNKDNILSTPEHQIFTEFKQSPILSEVFLGTAYFSLVELIKGFCTVETSSALTSVPVSSWDPVCDAEELIEKPDTYIDKRTVLEMFSKRGSIPEAMLLQHSTRVRVKVSILCQLSSLTDVQLVFMPLVFHRLIIVFKDNIYANNVVKHLKLSNMKLNELNTGLFTSESFSSLLKIPTASHELQESSRSSQYSPLNHTLTSKSCFNRLPSITNQMRNLHRMVTSSLRTMSGFFIESEEECILVLEAIPEVIPHAMELLQGISPSDGHVIYDSSLFFTKKLYSNLYPLNIFSIKLCKPLNILLKQSSIYLEKYSSHLAIHTLLMLDLLRKTRTLHGACINQLFPSCNQLIAFESMFGSLHTTTL